MEELDRDVMEEFLDIACGRNSTSNKKMVRIRKMYKEELRGIEDENLERLFLTSKPMRRMANVLANSAKIAGIEHITEEEKVKRILQLAFWAEVGGPLVASHEEVSCEISRMWHEMVKFKSQLHRLLDCDDDFTAMAEAIVKALHRRYAKIMDMKRKQIFNNISVATFYNDPSLFPCCSQHRRSRSVEAPERLPAPRLVIEQPASSR